MKFYDFLKFPLLFCSVTAFLSDMTGKSPLYKKAFVFFSSPVSRSLVNLIKKDMRAMKRIGGLKEVASICHFYIFSDFPYLHAISQDS
jgi:hypothetical protein